MMKYLLPSTLLTLTLALSSPGYAESIHSGSEAGSYFGSFCPQIEASIGQAYFEHSCVPSGGTLDNVEKVLGNPSDIGMGQWDVIAQLPSEQLDQLEIVDPNFGLECMYAVTGDDSITSLSNVSKRIPMAIPSEKSGSAGSFNFLTTLDEGLGSLRNVSNHASALDAVNSVVSGESAMAFFVQFPDTGNDVFKAVNKGKLSFIPVINRKILKQEVAGIKLYEPSEVNVTPKGFLASVTGKPAPTIATTCTKIVLFTGKSGLPQEDLTELVERLQAVERPTKGKWADVFNNVKTLGEETLAKYK